MKMDEEKLKEKDSIKNIDNEEDQKNDVEENWNNNMINQKRLRSEDSKEKEDQNLTKN